VVEYLFSKALWELSDLELRKGDSGSWVVEAETHNVLGYVVAISVGSAYLIPLNDLFEQIRQDCKPGTLINAPSPFRLLTRLAQYHFAVKPSGKSLADYYASEALSLEVLKSLPCDQVMRLLASAITQGEDRSLLVRLICSIEADLLPKLASFSTWPLEHQHNIDQDLVPVLIRMENRNPFSIPEVEISIAPGTVQMVDVEKGKTLQGNLSSTAPPFVITRL
jgi:hypothetical protein